MNIILDIIGYWSAITFINVIFGFWLIPLSATLLSSYYRSVTDGWDYIDEGDWGVAPVKPKKEKGECKDTRLLFRWLRWDWVVTKLGGLCSAILFGMFCISVITTDHMTFINALHKYGEFSGGFFSCIIILYFTWAALVKVGKVIMRIQKSIAKLEGKGKGKVNDEED